jgi:hypothetical protein
MKKILKLSLSCLLFSLSLMGAQSFATDTDTTPGSTTPEIIDPLTKLDQCTADIKQYCSDITPGKGRVLFCLKAHDDKITANCLTQVHQVMKEYKEIYHACKGDIEKFCKTVQPGEGRVLACLKQNQAQLSPECKSKL